MKLSSLTLLFALLFSVSACGQTEGHYVSVRTVTDVFFTDTILNIVTTDTTFRDTLLGTGGGGVVGPATQTMDTIDFDFLSTAANLPGATILNPDFTTEIPIPWSTSPVRTSARYTISGSDVSVAASGWYRVSGYLTTNPSNSQRYNGKVYLKKSGTLSDEWTATGYSRASNDQDETTLYFEFYTQLTAATPFQIVQICEGGQTGAANEVTLNNTASRLHVIPLTQNFVELASGPAGAAGSNGLSAYEIWLAQGNTGTEADFLASLQGEQGPIGPSGGPVGPPGPAGTSTDTAADGSYYRFFTTDDAGAYYNQGNIDGTAGIELFTSGQGDLYRIYPDDDGLIFDGKSFGFTNEFTTLGIQSEASSTAIFRNSMDFRISAAGTVFSDSRGTKKGMEYAADYSTDLMSSPRSIPDVGTVQEMIDDGVGGGSAPNAPFQQFTSATSVTPTTGTMITFIPSSNATLTINPANLTPGDILLIYLSNASATPTVATTTGQFYGSGGFSGATSFVNPFGNKFYLLIWSGTNWHYTQF